MSTNKGGIVKQSGNDVDGYQSQKVFVSTNVRVFLQYSVKYSNKINISIPLASALRMNIELRNALICRDLAQQGHGPLIPFIIFQC